MARPLNRYNCNCGAGSHLALWWRPRTSISRIARRSFVRWLLRSRAMQEESGSDEDESAPLVQPARPKVHWIDSAGTKSGSTNDLVCAQLAVIWLLLLYLTWDSLAVPKMEAPPVEPLPDEPSPPPSSRSAVLFSLQSAGIAAPTLAVPPDTNASASATAAAAAAAAASSAACPAAWVGDGVCQLGCASEPHGDRGDCRAPSAACDAQVGLGFLTQVRKARAPLCRNGRSSAWLHDVPDQGCRCATCRTKLAVLENVWLGWDEAGGAEPRKKRAQGVREPCLSARLACTAAAGALGQLALCTM